MKRALVSALALSMLTFSVPAPLPADPGPLTGSLVVTDAFGMRSPTLEQKWESRLITSLDGPSLNFTTGTGALGGPASSALNDSQRQALLAAPDLLTASSYVGQVVPSRYLLVVNVGDGDNPVMRPVLMDLSSHQAHPLADALGKNTDETVNLLTQNVRSYLTESAQQKEAPVKGNVLSKLYHKADADHIQAEDCVTFKSEADARNHGYQPCTICYPQSTAIIKNDATEVALGREVSAQVEQEYRISRDEKMKARVDRIGAHLVEASDIHDFPYTFTVLDSPEINAFSAGAGNVFITTGIINVLESDDEIATVLGHEMAHCENHHIIRTYRAAQKMSILGVIVGAATGGLGQFATNFMSMIFGRGYSRNFELQADHGGLLYTYAAGYKPEAFVLTLKKLKDEEAEHKGSKPPQWLRTHPTEDKRLEAVDAELATLHDYDAQVQEVRARDPGLADAMRRHAFFYVDHPEVMQAFNAAYASLHLASAPAMTTSVNDAHAAPQIQGTDTRD